MLLKKTALIVICIGLIGMFFSCSGSSNDKLSQIGAGWNPNLDAYPRADAPHSRVLLAVYEAEIDFSTLNITLTPVDLMIQYEYPFTQLYPETLRIKQQGFNQNFYADIELTHPLPDSGIDLFDPRITVFYPADPEVRFIYPEFNVEGFRRVLLEPDGFTRIFREMGTHMASNANPFIAYFKDEPYRRWSSTGNISETKRIKMGFDGLKKSTKFVIVVDASTNHPDPPTPIVDNASEPVEIDASIGSGLTNQGGKAEIEVRVKHWKDLEDISGVIIEAPTLLNDVLPIQYYSYSPHYDASVYKGTITNEKTAPQGRHSLMAKSWDVQTGIEMFDEFHADVSYITYGGNVMWAKHAAHSIFVTSLSINGITTTSDDSIATTGIFNESVLFAPGEPNETTLTGTGKIDSYVAKFNPDGSFLWAAPILEGRNNAITSLPDNSLVITGSFVDAVTFGKNEPNKTILTSTEEHNGYIARYNPDGTLNWAKKTGGPNYNYGNSVTALSDHSSVIIGSFKGTVTFGEGEPNETSLTSTSGRGSLDTFIARYNADGTLNWVKHILGTSSVISKEVIALSDNSTVITGHFWETATFAPGEANHISLLSAGRSDVFVARYSPDGTLMWAERSGDDRIDYAYDIAALPDDSIVLIGSTLRFRMEEDHDKYFIEKFNADGSIAWTRKIIRIPWGHSYAGITSLSDNSIIITGSFSAEPEYGFGITTYKNPVFGEGEPNETKLICDGEMNFYIAKYNPDGSLEWAKRASSPRISVGYAVKGLSDNSVVAVGHYIDETTFGPGEYNEITLSGGRFFIARFEP